jgi:circadian clock protein KaiC
MIDIEPANEHPPRSGVALSKAPTGIQGFDEISMGGLPRGRTTLVCGGAGCGKTLFGVEFLVRGATDFGEPGVLVSFEESTEELVANVASLGFDLARLVESGMIAMDHVAVDRSEIEETGEYDLEGLFVRLGYAIDRVGAKRVVLDTLEALFAALANEGILRAELRRLFRWLKDRGVTSVVTGERGDRMLSRHGLEEYVSDCVILLEQRVHDRIATRHLRIVKYRGSIHGTNEYPFLIHERGISVLPITSLGLDHPVTDERISTGVPRLDAMLGGRGLHRGSSVLVSGTAGSGKTSIAASAADAACRRGERVLYFAFEESRRQIVRNMRSIGVDLEPWCRSGLLRFHNARPTSFGLEMHLVAMHRQIEAFSPHLVVVDPITSLISIGSPTEVRAMLTRLVDYLKSRQTTAFFLTLTTRDTAPEHTEVGISSLMDAWLLLRFVESSGERNRSLYVLKARGTAHSNQLRELVLTDHGVDLADVYAGPTGGVLLGAERHVQEAEEQAASAARAQRIQRLERELRRRRARFDARLTDLRAELSADEEQILDSIAQETQLEEARLRDRGEMAKLRKADPAENGERTGEGTMKRERGDEGERAS